MFIVFDVFRYVECFDVLILVASMFSCFEVKLKEVLVEILRSIFSYTKRMFNENFIQINRQSEED
jgi:hypothetical protein